MVRKLIAVAAIFVLLGAAKAAKAAVGVTPFALGVSTGTTLVVVTASPASFYGIDISSAATGDLFKCWDAASVGGITISSSPTLGGEIYSASSAALPLPNGQPVKASAGIVCGKSSASSTAVIYWNP